ncbi:uncharacterized protein LOC129235196 [Uloborus diversus]|uniref:uncharacterized protein LOC129235196 n=1 Tax=Uloborus diversus TaxID=327109 RepID=UPI00240A75D7|nr:uncharacterized protein LOC129235196 [Uloborus diversus]
MSTDNAPLAATTGQVSRIALKLPPFWRANVRLWILQCDNAFLYSGITADETKYAALVANIDSETLSHVSDIVLNPPAQNKYQALAQRLISEFAESETLIIKKLLSDLQLGDDRPSQLLRKMKELSANRLDDNFLKNLWMQRMPPHISTILSASSESLDNSSKIADKIAEVSMPHSVFATTSSVPPPAPESPMEKLERQISELTRKVDELSTRNSRSPYRRSSTNRRRSNSRNEQRPSGMCYYHRRFQ